MTVKHVPNGRFVLSVHRSRHNKVVNRGGKRAVRPGKNRKVKDNKLNAIKRALTAQGTAYYLWRHVRRLRKG